MKVAFHQGHDKLFSILTSWWTAGPFSHCELVFADADPATGKSLCWSSSFLDGGVRCKAINLSTPDWVVIDIEVTPEQCTRAFQWFTDHQGAAYDVLGLIGFLWRPFGGDVNKWFCSEAVAESLGIRDSWRFDPNTLYAALVSGLNPSENKLDEYSTCCGSVDLPAGE